MRCPECRAKAQVAQTRIQPNGDVRRRYRCPACGTRYSTIELLMRDSTYNPQPKEKLDAAGILGL